ncbi:MAG: hypothetical protein HQL37_13570 [Alphaproteobacteria bacterium]|nr:hypothetical protein [Alphaproteobacteria bacterium]
MGKPALLRKEPPAEIWQYRGQGCIADVFLYEEGAALRVNLVEVRPIGGTQVPAPTCLGSIAGRHHTNE